MNSRKNIVNQIDEKIALLLKGIQSHDGLAKSNAEAIHVLLDVQMNLYNFDDFVQGEVQEWLKNKEEA